MRQRLGLWGDVFSIAQGVGFIFGSLVVIVGWVQEFPWPLTVALAMFAGGIGMVVVGMIRELSGGARPAGDLKALREEVEEFQKHTMEALTGINDTTTKTLDVIRGVQRNIGGIIDVLKKMVSEPPKRDDR